jgi:oleandomycin transport system ATP-binding protein
MAPERRRPCASWPRSCGADEGRATVCGLDVARQASQVRRLIGLTGQYASVDEDLTGVENLVLIGELLDLRRTEAKALARELLGQFSLTEVAERPGVRRRPMSR